MRFSEMFEILTVLSFLFISSFCQGVEPIWTSSQLFKAGAISFTFTSSASSTQQSGSITYSTPLINTSLRRPIMAINGLQYSIVGKRILINMTFTNWTVSGGTFSVTTNQKSYMPSLKFIYMAIQNQFTANIFTSSQLNWPLNKLSATGFTQQTNITFSTGNLTAGNENVLIPFLSTVDLTSYGTTIDLNFQITIISISQYNVKLTTTSNIQINNLAFFRLTLDKTAIEALGNNYFNYASVQAINNDNSQLQTTIPPDIIPSNFIFGIQSFSILTTNSQMRFQSSYNITTGLVGISSTGSFTYTKMKFNYFHHKSRNCPPTHIYYNIAERLCYNECNVRWFANNLTTTCDKCLYDCYTCTNSTSCLSCSSSIDFRTLNGSRCAAMDGYFNSGTDSIASTCASPCSTCVTNSTNCLSCITGYILFQNTCCPLTFTLSLTNGTGCVSCPDHLNCQRCDQTEICASCKTNYSLNPLDAKGCCLSGQTWSLTNGSYCVACPLSLNCKRCDVDNVCASCSDTYFKKPSNSSGCCKINFTWSLNDTCISCPSSLNGCLRCDVSNQCALCPSEYTVSASYTCAACPSALNCQRCDQNNVCAVCSNGYTLSTISGTGCVLCPQTLNCLQCDSDNQCSTCKPSFYLLPNTSKGCCASEQTWSQVAGSVCVSCSSILNCSRCNINNTCQICSTGFSKMPATAKGCCATGSEVTWSQTSSRCVACPSSLKCIRCDQQNKCSLCKSNYSFIPAQAPGCCLAGQMWSQISNSCVQCSSDLNCLKCDVSNQCSICLPQHKMLQINTVDMTRGCRHSPPKVNTFLMYIIISAVLGSIVIITTTILCLRAKKKKQIFNNQKQSSNVVVQQINQDDPFFFAQKAPPVSKDKFLQQNKNMQNSNENLFDQTRQKIKNMEEQLPRRKRARKSLF